MESSRAAELLAPFLTALSGPATRLSDTQLSSITAYLDLLMRWNARMNLTSIRNPEEIITRHFGESLFAARHIFPGGGAVSDTLIDVGSGAGFPGIPIKLWASEIRLILIESSHKKATFLGEVIRTLNLLNVEVFAGRAETFPRTGSVVTMRAVENFEYAVSKATNLVCPAGKVALLIGEAQTSLLPKEISWEEPIPIPQSTSTILFIGIKHGTGTKIIN